MNWVLVALKMYPLDSRRGTTMAGVGNGVPVVPTAVAVGRTVRVAVGRKVAVADTVGVAVIVGVTVRVAVTVGTGVNVGVIVIVGVGVACCTFSRRVSPHRRVVGGPTPFTGTAAKSTKSWSATGTAASGLVQVL